MPPVPPELMTTLGKLDGKVDILLERTKGQEERIRSLEKSRSWMRGVMGALGAVWALVTTIIFQLWDAK